jgi:hypothetical protein
MKILLMVILLSCNIPVALSQKKDRRGKPEKVAEIKPRKGDKTIIAQYAISGDSLYKKLIKSAVIFGYTVDKRDDEVLLFTTEMKPIDHISYKIRLLVTDSVAKITGEYINSIGVQIGSIKTEQKAEVLAYTSAIFVPRNAFDEVIKFVESTSPTVISYGK